MPRFNKRKRLLKEIAIERERQRKVRRMQEERGWESLEEEEDIRAIRLIQRIADLASDESDRLLILPFFLSFRAACFGTERLVSGFQFILLSSFTVILWYCHKPQASI